MIFTVTWAEAAIQALANIWNQPTTDRAALNAATNEIDAELRIDPDTVGRRTVGTIREWIHPPLGVEFEVLEPDRIVNVLFVWAVS
jgi:hypothetical protein